MTEGVDPFPPDKMVQDAINHSKKQGMNGKGSETRAYDKEKFDENFKGITSKCSHCRRTKPFGEACPKCGRR